MNHKRHIELWDYLTQTGTPIKSFVPIIMEFRPVNGCFACVEAGLEYEETNEEYAIRKHCMAHCPIDWTPFAEITDAYTPCETPGTPYAQWWNSEDPEERKQLAAVVRDLPWRKR